MGIRKYGAWSKKRTFEAKGTKIDMIINNND